jgi:acyl-CoA hydrolase
MSITETSAFRFPYQGDAATREKINAGAIEYQDMHLSHVGTLVRYGYMGKLDFGLIMFPDQTGDSCLQDGPIYVNVGVGHEATINTTLAATKPNNPCTTPIKPQDVDLPDIIFN